MKKKNTIENLENLYANLIENRKAQNEKYRRKKKIILFSFFSFLFVTILSIFLYKFYFSEIKFTQTLNSKYVDTVVYLSTSNFKIELENSFKLEKDVKKEETTKNDQIRTTPLKEYVVQIGVFKDLENVTKLKNKLEKKGFAIYYEKSESFYRLRMLKTFTTRDSAEKYASELKTNKVIDDYFIRVK